MYISQVSGERLQDHWSSGLLLLVYFFEVNTKYISSSELKTSKFSRVRSTSENLDVFKSRDEIYLVFTDKK